MIKNCAHPIREILGRTREHYTIKCMTCDREYEESETGLAEKLGVKDLDIALANEKGDA